MVSHSNLEVLVPFWLMGFDPKLQDETELGMPRLGQFRPILDSVFFLYRSAEDAKAGKKSGGTGFLVSIPSEARPGFGYVYAVTNWHVACHGASCIRFNNQDGTTTILEHGPEEWHFIPGKQDIAVLPLDVMLPTYKCFYLMTDRFFPKEEEIREEKFGVGDNVFMIGRFVDYDGAETNKPALRFGHISMSSVPIKQPTQSLGDSVVVDMHSRTGFSGSPVFVYQTTGNNLDDYYTDVTTFSFSVGTRVWLLGIQWGQFPERWKIKEIEKGRSASATNSMESEGLITDGKYVEGMSGMSCVCPASDIMEVLNIPKLKKDRENAEASSRTGDGNGPVSEIADIDLAGKPDDAIASGENPQHQEDFMRLLNAAARTRPQGE